MRVSHGLVIGRSNERKSSISMYRLHGDRDRFYVRAYVGGMLNLYQTQNQFRGWPRRD